MEEESFLLKKRNEMEVKIKKLINRKIAKWILENILIYRKKV